MKIDALLISPEGKTLEFKRDLSSPAGVLKTVVAFANTSGGTILIGVEDDSRIVRGVKDPFQLEERIASMVADSITPKVLPDIEIHPFRDTHILAVQVYPGPSRPYFLSKKGQNGGSFVRVGSTNRLADAAMLSEMTRFCLGEAYDEQAIPALNSEAIDFRVASESFADIRGLKRKDLETLGILTVYQNHKVPTVGGLLLYGVDRLKHFPDAWIQAGRFRGVDKSTIVDAVEIRKPLHLAIEDADEFVQKHDFRAEKIEHLKRQSIWQYPRVAVREALTNAVVHTDYSQTGAPIRVAFYDDRLEIENPGLLPFGISIADLPSGISKLRNRVIGRVFHELGLIEQWGSGVQRMIAACKAAGSPEPVWEEIGFRVRVTLWSGLEKNPVEDPTETAILNLLSGAASGLGTRHIAEAIELSVRATRSRLIKLIERGLVLEIGKGANDPQKKYFLAKN